MAKRNGKKTDDEGTDGTQAIGGNFKKAVSEFVGRIENLHADLETEKSRYMNACKPIHDDIAEIYAEAKGEGIKPKALKAAVKMRDLERKKEKQREKLDVDDQNELDRIRLALGDLEDTPLGQAAMAEAEQHAQAH